MSKPSSISIVITCFSEGKLLFEAVESIYQQSNLPLEIVLVNDASPDPETNATCHELSKQPLVHLIKRSSNGGTSVARNDGFAAACGSVIVPLDGDDLLPPNALGEIQKAFDQNPEIDFLYGAYLREDNPGHIKQIHPADITLHRMLKAKPFRLGSQWSLIGTTPLRRSTWERVHGYDPELGVDDLHDVDFWIRVLNLTCKHVYSPQPLYHWRKYLGNNSRKVTPLAWYRIAKKNFEIYQNIGLEYRAHELLLLGSKWQEKGLESQRYAAALQHNMLQGSIHLSSLIALMVPTNLLKKGAALLQKHR